MLYLRPLFIHSVYTSLHLLSQIPLLRLPASLPPATTSLCSKPLILFLFHRQVHFVLFETPHISDVGICLSNSLHLVWKSLVASMWLQNGITWFFFFLIKPELLAVASGWGLREAPGNLSPLGWGFPRRPVSSVICDRHELCQVGGRFKPPKEEAVTSSLAPSWI